MEGRELGKTGLVFLFPPFFVLEFWCFFFSFRMRVLEVKSALAKIEWRRRRNMQACAHVYIYMCVFVCGFGTELVGIISRFVNWKEREREREDILSGACEKKRHTQTDGQTDRKGEIMGCKQ